MDITDEDWAILCSEDVEREIEHLISAVKTITTLQTAFVPHFSSSSLDADLLRLQRLAISVFHHKKRHSVAPLFILADQLQQQINKLLDALEEIGAAVFELTALMLRSLCVDKKPSVASELTD